MIPELQVTFTAKLKTDHEGFPTIDSDMDFSLTGAVNNDLISGIALTLAKSFTDHLKDHINAVYEARKISRS